MRWSLFVLVLVLNLAVSAPGSAQRSSPSSGATSDRSLSVGGLVGFQNGLSLQLHGIARDFAQGLPFHARIRFGRTSVEPGIPLDARRIFINDAAVGQPTWRPTFLAGLSYRLGG